MGCEKTIDYDKFPKQGNQLNRKCQVCFNFNTKHVLQGIVIRDDMEAPHRSVIRLEDGRVILGTECQYSMVVESTECGSKSS